MERPNFDFNFDLDCTSDRQKEIEEMSTKPEPLVQERPNFHFNFDWDGTVDRQEPLSKRAEKYAREAKSKSTKQKTLFWLRGTGLEETAKALGIAHWRPQGGGGGTGATAPPLAQKGGAILSFGPTFETRKQCFKTS